MKIVKGKVQALNCCGKAEAVLKQWEKLGKPEPKFYQKAGGCCGK